MDVEIWAADLPTMIAAAKLVGCWRNPDPTIPGDTGGIVESTRDAAGNVFAINVYGTKFIAGVAQPGIYGIGRWLPADGVSPPPSAPGVTVIPMPANSPIRWA